MGGIYPHLFHDKAGNGVDAAEAENEMDTAEEDGASCPNSCKHFMNSPDAAPNTFNRKLNLDG